LAKRRGYGDAEQVLHHIKWSLDIPSDPVAIHTADNEVRQYVFDALTDLAKPDDTESEGNKAVMAFWGTSEGVERIDPNAYAFLLGCTSRNGDAKGSACDVLHVRIVPTGV
jgi:hypothetical protein